MVQVQMQLFKVV